MGLRDVARCLVVRAMVDKRIVEAVYDYFKDGHGDLARRAERYGLSKLRLRGHIQRVLEKEPHYYRARIFVKYLAPIVLRVVEPVFESSDRGLVCKPCKAVVSLDFAALHVLNRHSDLVDYYVDRVIEVLKVRRCSISSSTIS